MGASRQMDPCLDLLCIDLTIPGKSEAGEKTYGNFPKIRGTFLGAPIIRTIVYSGLY